MPSPRFDLQATPSDEIVLEELRRRYDSLWNRAQAINTKAGALLALHGATILILLGNRESLLSLLNELQSGLGWIHILAALDVVLFLGGVLYAMRTLVSYMFPYPDPEGVAEALDYIGQPRFHYLRSRKDMKREDFLDKFLDGYAYVVDKSARSAIRKNRAYRASLVFTTGFMVLLFTISIVGYPLTS